MFSSKSEETANWNESFSRCDAYQERTSSVTSTHPLSITPLHRILALSLKKENLAT